MLRIVYDSRAIESADGPATAADLRDIRSAAAEFNQAHGISGLLIVANGHFLQVLEGPQAATDKLFERISQDTRHRDVALLSRIEIHARSFGTWSMGLVERVEAEALTIARFALLRDRLARDPEVDAADFCRLLLAPSVNKARSLRVPTRLHREPVPTAAFVSPSGLWSAAMLQHVSSTTMRRTGRTSVFDPDDPARRTLIEYIDVEQRGTGPLRVLSLAVEPAAFGSVAPLMEQLSLLVFTMASSDVEAFTSYVGSWLNVPQVLAAAPRVLVLAGLPKDRCGQMLETLAAGTTLTIDFACVRLSDSAAVWAAAQKPLEGLRAARSSVAEARLWASNTQYETLPGKFDPAPARHRAATLFPVRRLEGFKAAEPVAYSPATTPAAVSAVALEATVARSTVIAEAVAKAGSLQKLLGLEGAVSVSLIDADRREVLLTLDRPGTAPHSLDDMHFLSLKRNLITSVARDESIEDIAVTTRLRLDIYRALPRRPHLFLAVKLDREHAQLAVARLRLQDIVDELALD